MPTLDEFLAKQESTYDSIRNAGKEAYEKGIDHDPDLKTQRGGCFIVLRHSPEVERAAESFSRHIAGLIPAIIYERSHIHTTLGGHGYDPGIRVDPKDKEHVRILSALSHAAYVAVRNLTSKPTIDYTGFLHSRYVAIARGTPNQGFVDLVRKLYEACALEGYKIKPAWGAHMTLNRFTGTKPASELGPFFELIAKFPPFGMSVPVAVEIGYADWSHESHHGHFIPYAALAL